jgi:hypothetical protein
MATESKVMQFVPFNHHCDIAEGFAKKKQEGRCQEEDNRSRLENDLRRRRLFTSAL